MHGAQNVFFRITGATTLHQIFGERRMRGGIIRIIPRHFLQLGVSVEIFYLYETPRFVLQPAFIECISGRRYGKRRERFFLLISDIIKRMIENVLRSFRKIMGNTSSCFFASATGNSMLYVWFAEPEAGSLVSGIKGAE